MHSKVCLNENTTDEYIQLFGRQKEQPLFAKISSTANDFSKAVQNKTFPEINGNNQYTTPDPSVVLLTRAHKSVGLLSSTAIDDNKKEEVEKKIQEEQENKKEKVLQKDEQRLEQLRQVEKGNQKELTVSKKIVEDRANFWINSTSLSDDTDKNRQISEELPNNKNVQQTTQKEAQKGIEEEQEEKIKPFLRKEKQRLEQGEEDNQQELKILKKPLEDGANFRINITLLSDDTDKNKELSEELPNHQEIQQEPEEEAQERIEEDQEKKMEAELQKDEQLRQKDEDNQQELKILKKPVEDGENFKINITLLNDDTDQDRQLSEELPSHKEIQQKTQEEAQDRIEEEQKKKIEQNLQEEEQKLKQLRPADKVKPKTRRIVIGKKIVEDRSNFWNNSNRLSDNKNKNYTENKIRSIVRKLLAEEGRPIDEIDLELLVTLYMRRREILQTIRKANNSKKSSLLAELNTIDKQISKELPRDCLEKIHQKTKEEAQEILEEEQKMTENLLRKETEEKQSQQREKAKQKSRRIAIRNFRNNSARLNGGNNKINTENKITGFIRELLTEEGQPIHEIQLKLLVRLYLRRREIVQMLRKENNSLNSSLLAEELDTIDQQISEELPNHLDNIQQKTQEEAQEQIEEEQERTEDLLRKETEEKQLQQAEKGKQKTRRIVADRGNFRNTSNSAQLCDDNNKIDTENKIRGFIRELLTKEGQPIDANQLELLVRLYMRRREIIQMLRKENNSINISLLAAELETIDEQISKELPNHLENIQQKTQEEAQAKIEEEQKRTEDILRKETKEKQLKQAEKARQKGHKELKLMKKNDEDELALLSLLGMKDSVKAETKTNTPTFNDDDDDEKNMEKISTFRVKIAHPSSEQKRLSLKMSYEEKGNLVDKKNLSIEALYIERAEIRKKLIIKKNTYAKKLLHENLIEIDQHLVRKLAAEIKEAQKLQAKAKNIEFDSSEVTEELESEESEAQKLQEKVKKLDFNLSKETKELGSEESISKFYSEEIKIEPNNDPMKLLISGNKYGAGIQQEPKQGSAFSSLWRSIMPQWKRKITQATNERSTRQLKKLPGVQKRYA